MAQPHRFEVIEEDDETPAPSTPDKSASADKSTEAFVAVLDKLLGLKSLAQRAAIAIADLFSLITVATVFWLCLAIVPYEPTTYQLAGLCGYALFIVAVNVIVRRK